MKPKRKVTHREVWLVSLLPAALVVIVSMALPGPADEIRAAEQRLNQLTSGDAHERLHTEYREITAQLQESQRALTELEAREAELEAQISTFASPTRPAQRLEMAQTLDELTRRLGEHGVQVLAMTEAQGSKSNASPAMVAKADWRVSVAATWPAMSEALSDDDTFPQGLALSAMKMEKPRPNLSLQRWELIVVDLGATR